MCRPPALAEAPFPWKAVGVLCLGNVAHFYGICSVFSYAGFLCVDLGWVRDLFPRRASHPLAYRPRTATPRASSRGSSGER